MKKGSACVIATGRVATQQLASTPMQPVLTVNAVCVAVQVGDENYEDASLLQLTAGVRRQRNSASQSHDVDDESSPSSSSSSAEDEDSSCSGCSSNEG